MTALTFAYKPKSAQTAAAVVLCAALAIYMVHAASTNHQGLVIQGLIHLAPRGATIFYWITTIMLSTVALLAMKSFIQSLSREHRVVLTDTYLSAPRSAHAKEPVRIPLADIRNLEMRTAGATSLLIVHHRKGKLPIVQSCLPKPADFEALRTALSSYARQPRQARKA